MEKLLQYIVLILFVSVNSVTGAWYATYYNGDFNYVLATGRMGGCKYVKLDSVLEEYKDSDVSILSVDGITVVNADMCDLTVLENWACKYKYDGNDTKMYGLTNENTYYYDLSGPAFNYRGATTGEIAYVIKYGNKFYGSLLNKEYFGEMFYRGFLNEQLDGIPSKILGRWEAGPDEKCFEFASDMIKQIDSNDEVVSCNKVNCITGLNNLKRMNRYRINVDDGRIFDFYYYDLEKEKILVSGDSKIILHRTSDTEIGELLGGIYIGMPMKKVVDYNGPFVKTKIENFLSVLI